MSRHRTPWGTVRAWFRGRHWTRRGRRALREGRVPEALEAFELAVSWRPRAFGPLLDLATAYLKAEETWRAHRALARARESHPGRFLREASTRMTRAGVDPRALARLLAFDPSDARRVPAAAGARVAQARVVSPASLPYGDCRDLDEYARFQAMPPISDDERETVDWDAVLEDLLED